MKENKPYKYVKEFVVNLDAYAAWMAGCIVEENKKGPFSNMGNPSDIVSIDGDIVTVRTLLKFFRPKYRGPRNIKNEASEHQRVWKVRVSMEWIE